PSPARSSQSECARLAPLRPCSRTTEDNTMAVTCPVDLDTLTLRREIQSIYARVATTPSGDFHFHRGPDYAASVLGYDAAALAALPTESTASFAGVSNPHRINPLQAGATVVDIGCGAGMD